MIVTFIFREKISLMLDSSRISESSSSYKNLLIVGNFSVLCPHSNYQTRLHCNKAVFKYIHIFFSCWQCAPFNKIPQTPGKCGFHYVFVLFRGFFSPPFFYQHYTSHSKRENRDYNWKPHTQGFY